MIGPPFARVCVCVPFALLSTALSHPRLSRSTLSPSMALFDECDIVDDDLLSTAFDEVQQHMQLPYQGGAAPLVSQHGGPAVGMKRDAPWHPDSAPPGCVCARQGDKQLVVVPTGQVCSLAPRCPPQPAPVPRRLRRWRRISRRRQRARATTAKGARLEAIALGVLHCV